MNGSSRHAEATTKKSTFSAHNASHKRWSRKVIWSDAAWLSLRTENQKVCQEKCPLLIRILVKRIMIFLVSITPTLIAVVFPSLQVVGIWKSSHSHPLQMHPQSIWKAVPSSSRHHMAAKPSISVIKIHSRYCQIKTQGGNRFTKLIR